MMLFYFFISSGKAIGRAGAEGRSAARFFELSCRGTVPTIDKLFISSLAQEEDIKSQLSKGCQNADPEGLTMETKGFFQLKPIYYLLGVAIIFICVYSQYLVNIGFVGDLLLVYGVPILAITLLMRRQIISRALNQMKSALLFGFGYFGIFTVVGVTVAVVIYIAILALNPNALQLLDRPNPVLNISPNFALLMIILSFVVLAPAEEYIFRGFVFGGLVSIFKGKHWLFLAFVSSLLFAAAHLYYALVYGVASLILFVIIVSFGMAMAMTYYLSGGNLIAPILVHGAYDAAGFAGVAYTMDVAVDLRGALILIGIVAGILMFVLRWLHGKNNEDNVVAASPTPPVSPPPPQPTPPAPA
jgi:membrane protease YdiL (CAAX protease family)